METIGTIYGIDRNTVEINCDLDVWFINLLSKTIDQLNINDVCRMLKQNIFVEAAIRKSICLLRDNPFVGNVFDGQLLELLISVKFTNNDDLLIIKSLLEDISQQQLDNYDWLSDEDKAEYIDLINVFLNKE